MRRIRRTLLLLGISTAFLGPAQADAQLGGLIKRKAQEAIKGPAKEQPAKPPGTASSDDYDAKMKEIYAKAPHVVPITTDQLVRFEKALKFEISERDALRKEKPPTTPEQYQTCSANTVVSPEIMKISDDFANATANASVEETLKAQQKMYEKMQAVITKRCGEDPKQWEIRRDARLAEVEGRASDIAMPPGWLPQSTDSTAPPPSDQWGSDAGDSEKSIEAAGVPHPFLRAYSILKERIATFCIIYTGEDVDWQVGASGVGVRAPHPDTGRGKFLVIYSSAEAEALKPRCKSLNPGLRILFPNTFTK